MLHWFILLSSLAQAYTPVPCPAEMSPRLLTLQELQCFFRRTWFSPLTRENFIFLPGAELLMKAFRAEICPNLPGSSKCRGLQSIVNFLGAYKEAQTTAVLMSGRKAALWVLAQLWLGDLLAQCPRKMRLTQPCCLFLTAGSELESSDSAGGFP